MIKIFVCSFLLCATVFAQEFRSTVSGRVTDPSGAAIVSAQVVASERNTGAKHETTSGSDGGYSLPFLPPGQYVLSAESAGFKKFVQGRPDCRRQCAPGH